MHLEERGVLVVCNLSFKHRILLEPEAQVVCSLSVQFQLIWERECPVVCNRSVKVTMFLEGDSQVDTRQQHPCSVAL